MDMDTNVIGLLTEMRVASEFIKRGFEVSTPLNKSSRYDMIVDAFGGLFKVQVKSSSDTKKSEGGFKIYTRSVHKINGNWDSRKYSSNEVDLFATVHNDHVYVIPYSVVGDQGELTLRSTPPKNNQNTNVHYADYYELDNVINRWNGFIDTNNTPLLQ